MLRVAVAVAVMFVVATADVPWYKCNDRGWSGGKVCGPDGLLCHNSEDKCEENTCKCKSGKGQPRLMCAYGGDSFASVINDPWAFTMNNRETAEVPVMGCPYLFSHVKTKVTESESAPNGECDIKVYLTNKRIEGKLFVGGYEIKVKCTNMKETHDLHIYKADAYVNSDGDYCFLLQISNNGGDSFKVNNFYGTANRIDGARFSFAQDSFHNLANLYISNIGLKVRFRPYNPSYDVFHQKYLPGFTVRFSNDVEFLSKDKVVSLVPGDTLIQAAGPTRTPTQELTYRGYRYNDVQSGTCYEVGSALDSCSGETTKALSKCSFVLDTPKFINCHGTDSSDDVERSLGLYLQCLKWFCSKDVNMCNSMRDSLLTLPQSCQDNVPAEIREINCQS